MDILLWLLIVGLLVLCLLLVIALRMSQGKASKASRARNAHAQWGEQEAERLLRTAGYAILDRQVARSWAMEVDGEDYEASVRADLLVKKDGQVYVAEVKTGRLAPDPLYPPTRRQLLEYLFVFDPDGLLVVDVESRSIREVVFQLA